jgi:hypothetical protein
MDDLQGERPLYANCALCGAAIRWGDRLVTIARYDEQLQGDGSVEVTGEDTLVSLCSPCGLRHPVSAVQLDVGGRPFRGTEGRGY